MNTESSTLKFKTNINCGGCVAAIAPVLDNADGIEHWEVDTTDKDKILAVHSLSLSPEEVVQKVQDAGFQIEPINN